MPKVRVPAFAISLDGFAAGPRQDLWNPLGVRGLELHDWFFRTATFQAIRSQSGSSPTSNLVDGSPGTTGIENDIAAQSFENVGAWIMGRNMFGPVRGPWPDESWRGWWGENPPFHTSVYVLTHHARQPLAMEGGTTFYFVTAGIESALQKATKAANGKDVRIGGGVSTIRQYLLAGHIDEIHLALSPVLLGEGEHLFHGINLHRLGFAPFRTVAGENATHIFIKKK